MLGNHLRVCVENLPKQSQQMSVTQKGWFSRGCDRACQSEGHRGPAEMVKWSLNTQCLLWRGTGEDGETSDFVLSWEAAWMSSPSSWLFQLALSCPVG